MIESAIAPAVKTLGHLLAQPIAGRLSFREDLEWLKREFRYMQSFLTRAGTIYIADTGFQEIGAEIASLARETTDILNEFNIKVGNGETANAKAVDRIKNAVSFLGKEFYINATGKRIKSVKEKVFDLSRKRNTYDITSVSNAGEGPSHNGSSLRQLRRTSPYADGEVFVGRVDERKMLLMELLEGEVRRCVISIYGTGGIGKTTLAREIYKSAGGFECRAWVCVSQEYSIKDLLWTIITSLEGKSSGEGLKVPERMDEAYLEVHLRKLLDKKKYLIVVDDVWKVAAWQSLRRAIPDCLNGSRVIITTRNENVAKRTDEKTFVHHLRNLNPVESRDLFKKKISQRDGSAHWFSPAMKNVGWEMVEKCRGLPLAIVVLGGLLSSKEELDEWLSVQEQLWQHLKDDSIEISHLFTLSYNDLSTPFKDCFLYAGIFPEDHKFKSKTLMQLWMAEGFIQGNNMERDAWHCLRELISRCLIEVAKESWRGIEACRIHDLLRDLLVAEAMKSNLFDIYDTRVYGDAPSGNALRLAIHHTGERSFLDIHYPEELKSLLIFNLQQSVDNKKLKTICKKFKTLSVLYYNGFSDNSRGLPPDIKNLSRLKFLALEYIRSLPPSIGKLKSLQTLQIRGIFYPCEIPMDVSQLINLRHLDVGRYKGDFQLDCLTNLRALNIKYEHWVKNDTANLVSLQELYLEDIEQIEGMAYSLHSIRNLTNLTTLSLESYRETLPSLQPLLHCPHLSKLQVIGKIAKLLQPDEFPGCLEMLELKKTGLLRDPTHILEKLPNLRSLYLDEAFLGVTIKCSNNGFLRLEHLSLSNLPKLEKLKLAAEAMPFIQSLTITNCSSLKTIPERLVTIASRK